MYTLNENDYKFNNITIVTKCLVLTKAWTRVKFVHRTQMRYPHFSTFVAKFQMDEQDGRADGQGQIYMTLSH